MSKEHLENIDFNFIRYANCWEDPEILIEAFELNQNSEVISIASGGDNCFSLAAQGPKRVIAVDISSVQLFLVELKKIAIEHLNREQYLEFAGFKKSDNRIDVYDNLKSSLSSRAKDYWDLYTNEIAEGIIHIGKFERYFQLFKKEFLHTIQKQNNIDELFRVKSAEKQLGFYKDTWFDKNWKKMHSSFFNEKMLGEKGRDPEFMKQIEGSVADLILEREVAHLKSVLCQTNPFLFYILNNSFDENHLPHYVRKENFDAVKSNLHKVYLEEGLLREITAKYSGCTHFNLSNIFEYMDSEQFQTVAKKILENSTDSAMFAYWNFMVNRNMVDILPEKVEDQKIKSDLLSSRDCGYFYKSFILSQKR